jgi:hypothetical protein
VTGAGLNAVSVAAGPVARGSVARVGLATAVSALCGYGVLYLAARRLEPAGFSIFGVFWGAFGLVTGAANGLLQEATREVRSMGAPAGSGTAHTRPMWVAVGVGMAAAVAIGATSPLWAPHVFAESRPLSVALLAMGLAGFCLHATLLGMLAGTGRWAHYGALMVTDAATRLGLAVAAYVLDWGLAGYRITGLAAAAGGLTGGAFGGPIAHRRCGVGFSARGGAFHCRGRCQRDSGDGFPGAAQGHLRSTRRRRWCGDPGGHADQGAASGADDGHAGQSHRQLRRSP